MAPSQPESTAPVLSAVSPPQTHWDFDRLRIADEGVRLGACHHWSGARWRQATGRSILARADQAGVDQLAHRLPDVYQWQGSEHRARDDCEWRPLRLCFDSETGLIVRLVRFSNSTVGRRITFRQACA